MQGDRNLRGSEQPRELPPVILHPFDTRPETNSLVDSAIGPHPELKYLESRFSELRMLCFLGKDLERWVSQCVDTAAQDEAWKGATEASFIALLLFDPPASVTRKLTQWGVGNYQIVFSRALGLNTVYPFPPASNSVSEHLLRNFHLYADALFDMRLKMRPGIELRGEDCAFEIYASSEYSKLLERSWENPPDAG